MDMRNGHEEWKGKLSRIYFRKERDWDEFFRNVLEAMKTIGIDKTLTIWEELVWQKRKMVGRKFTQNKVNW